MPRAPRAVDVDAEAELHGTIDRRLRRDHQRYTPGRRLLVEVLVSSPRPATIHELVGGPPGIPLSSAYRNLAVLERAGVVRRIVTGDEHARYELAEDLAGHHHHAICGSCGRVEDFTVSSQLERSLENALARVADGIGFRAEHHRLDLVGTCPDCT